MYICLMLNLFNSTDISKRFPTYREGLRKKRKNKNPELFIFWPPWPSIISDCNSCSNPYKRPPSCKILLFWYFGASFRHWDCGQKSRETWKVLSIKLHSWLLKLFGNFQTDRRQQSFQINVKNETLEIAMVLRQVFLGNAQYIYHINYRQKVLFVPS